MLALSGFNVIPAMIHRFIIIGLSVCCVKRFRFMAIRSTNKYTSAVAKTSPALEPMPIPMRWMIRLFRRTATQIPALKCNNSEFALSSFLFYLRVFSLFFLSIFIFSQDRTTTNTNHPEISSAFAN